MKAPKNHYLLVWNKYNRLEILNCSQETSKSDTVLGLMTKDQYWDFETEFINSCTSMEAAVSCIELFLSRQRA